MSRKRLKTRRYDPLAVLAYIAAYQQQNAGRSPSQRRIQAALAMSAPSVAHNILHGLERRGLLRITSYGRGVGADLTLTEAGRAALERWQAEQGRREQG